MSLQVQYYYSWGTYVTFLQYVYYQFQKLKLILLTWIFKKEKFASLAEKVLYPYQKLFWKLIALILRHAKYAHYSTISCYLRMVFASWCGNGSTSIQTSCWTYIVESFCFSNYIALEHFAFTFTEACYLFYYHPHHCFRGLLSTLQQSSSVNVCSLQCNAKNNVFCHGETS